MSLAKDFPRSSQWVERAARCDAWVATREAIIPNDRFIDRAFPLYASRGNGAYIWDVDGNRYVDYILGYGTVILGHDDRRVVDAVIAELNFGTNLSPLWRPPQASLTELLTSTIPGAEMAFLMRTGSDATSGALRLARIFTGRDKVVRWGYNGWHDWSCPRTDGIPSAVRANTLTFRYNDIESLRTIFHKHSGEIACVLMMPFELEPPHTGFLQEARTVAHQHGALLILDEMRSGFRMALGGAQQYFGVVADLATFSKAMANGFCISAITGRADVLQCLGRTHMASTFYTNSCEMIAALTTINILKSSDALERVWLAGADLQRGLHALIEEFHIPARVNGYPPCPFLAFDPESTAAQKAKVIFYREVTRRGVLFHPSHHWFVSSAHTQSDIEYTVQACREAFSIVRESLNGP
jgi:glutamate-1-semialdehyde 2,1-aminomutase